jgi:hypothetical protein
MTAYLILYNISWEYEVTFLVSKNRSMFLIGMLCLGFVPATLGTMGASALRLLKSE